MKNPWKFVLSRHIKQQGLEAQPRRDSNPQSSDPKSDALSIRPRGRNRVFQRTEAVLIRLCGLNRGLFQEARGAGHIKQKGLEGQPRKDSNPQSSDPKSEALSIRPRGRNRVFQRTEAVLIRLCGLNRGLFQEARGAGHIKQQGLEAQPRRDSNPQSSDPKSDALSIRPRGRNRVFQRTEAVLIRLCGLNRGLFQEARGAGHIKQQGLEAQPRRDSNPQSSDPKSDALSIRPRGRNRVFQRTEAVLIRLCGLNRGLFQEARGAGHIKQKGLEGQPRKDSNPQSSDPKSEALSIRPRGRNRVFQRTEAVLIRLCGLNRGLFQEARGAGHIKQKGLEAQPQRDSNPQSSDPKSDALSIRPRGRNRVFQRTEAVLIRLCGLNRGFFQEARGAGHIKQKGLEAQPRRDSNPQSSDTKSDALSIRPRGRNRVFQRTEAVLIRLCGLNRGFFRRLEELGE
ncbi:hypothetical protein Q8A73_023755 [Channa argus]|nr:hypothetical protein Q8A73_023755 [Channa argus]